MNNDEKEWSEEEARALRDLSGLGAAPPTSLKPRLGRVLDDLGLISGRRPWLRFAWAVAAVIAVVGFGLGRLSTGSQKESAPIGQRYVLLLRGGESATPAENAYRRREYGDWLRSLQRRGLGVSGEELVGEVRELPGPRSDQPVVGFFVITAPNPAEAVSIARSTPHLRHGGGVTIAALR